MIRNRTVLGLPTTLPEESTVVIVTVWTLPLPGAELTLGENGEVHDTAGPPSTLQRKLTAGLPELKLTWIFTLFFLVRSTCLRFLCFFLIPWTLVPAEPPLGPGGGGGGGGGPAASSTEPMSVPSLAFAGLVSTVR